MSQVDDAESRRSAWLAKGNPPCEHARVRKEYYLGSHTGDYVCSECGESGVGADWPERERTERAQRIEAALTTLKREQLQATRKLIELRRDQHVQRMLADREQATKAAGSRDACDTMLSDLVALEAELPR